MAKRTKKLTQVRIEKDVEGRVNGLAARDGRTFQAQINLLLRIGLRAK